jgi:hypothetical protein
LENATRAAAKKVLRSEDDAGAVLRCGNLLGAISHHLNSNSVLHLAHSLLHHASSLEKRIPDHLRDDTGERPQEMNYGTTLPAVNNNDIDNLFATLLDR